MQTGKMQPSGAGSAALPPTRRLRNREEDRKGRSRFHGGERAGKHGTVRAKSTRAEPVRHRSPGITQERETQVVG